MTVAATGSFAPVTWVNGTRQRPDAAHISARDRGFILADGVFETMRVRQGRVFRLDRHLARLTRSLRILRIRCDLDLRELVLRAVSEVPAVEASMRLTVSRGVGPGGLAPPDGPATVVIGVGPMPAIPDRVYQDGLSAVVVAGRRNERSMTNGLKTLSYTDAVAGLMAATASGADEAIFLDTEDHCSEASASNLFGWTGSALLTPPVSCGALPGITRATVIEIAAAMGIEVQERPFGLSELSGGREAFLTSSLRGIAPLVRVDGAAIGAGVPGATTQAVTAAYAQLVDRECSEGREG